MSIDYFNKKNLLCFECMELLKLTQKVLYIVILILEMTLIYQLPNAWQ